MSRIAAVLFLVMLSLCVHAQETIKIGAEDDWYPYSGVVDGQARGMAEDIVSAAFSAVGVHVEFVSLPYSRCMREVLAGSLPGCFDAARNSVLEDRYLWEDKPIFIARVNIYALASSHEGGLITRNLEGKTVAVTNAYEYGDSFDRDTLVLRDVGMRDIQGFHKLAVGHVSYMVAYEQVAQYLFARYPADLRNRFRVVGETARPALYVAFSRSFPGNPGMVARFSAGLRTVINNGQYRAIEKRWSTAIPGADH